MQIVIDISDDDYRKVQDGRASVSIMRNSIRNGAPLPKVHGRLIDYSWVVENVIKKLGIKDRRYLLEAEKALMSIVDIAPTIIEADKAESEDAQ